MEQTSNKAARYNPNNPNNPDNNPNNPNNSPNNPNSPNPNPNNHDNPLMITLRNLMTLICSSSGVPTSIATATTELPLTTITTTN